MTRPPRGDPRGPHATPRRKAERTAARREPRRESGGQRPAEPVPPLSLLHPGMLAALLVCAACIVFVLTTRIIDTDLWWHLAVGRAIWTLGHVPATQIWNWPTFGTPDVNSSWGFETQLWPFWKTGGVGGLEVWRWLAGLATFALSLAAARRMGARGLGPLVVVVLGALAYHRRAQLRPETLVLVLLALQVWILESRRRGGPERAFWLVPVAWLWANTHISWHIGVAFPAFHLLDAWLGRDRARARGLLLAMVAAFAISFLNPFGWRALWQPFDFLLTQRDLPLTRIVTELGPLQWRPNLLTGLPLLVAGWPLLLLWRWRRHGLDRVEILACVAFTALALLVQRFVTYYVVAATPFLARDVDSWLASRRAPSWSRPAWSRAALASAACLALAATTLYDPGLRRGRGLDTARLPVRACDFIAAHGVRGRMFNHFYLGGYILHRFWPDRGRLPFMDGRMGGGATLQARYLGALSSSGGWQALRDQRGIDYVVLWRTQVPGDHLLDTLDADSTFALVFLDDVGVVYVRRRGPLAAVADSFRYRTLKAGESSMASLAAAFPGDSAVRRAARSELERAARESEANLRALSLLANLAMDEHRWEDARRLLAIALEKEPRGTTLHLRLAVVALQAGRPAEALRECEAERALAPREPGLDRVAGVAAMLLGRSTEARRYLRRALAGDPGDAIAAAALRELESGGPAGPGRR